MTSMTYSDWFQKIMDEALAAPSRRDPIPALKPPLTPAQGASEQLQALLLIEGFGLPEPSTDPIRCHDMRL
ncbi:MAG TPA: hypothetical protein VGH81_15250 [Rudaea sp.]|jgi:hypothetical protein